MSLGTSVSGESEERSSIFSGAVADVDDDVFADWVGVSFLERGLLCRQCFETYCRGFLVQVFVAFFLVDLVVDLLS